MYKNSLEKKANGYKGVKFFTENCLMNNPMYIEKLCKNEKVSGFTSEQIKQVQNEMCENGKPPKISAENGDAFCFRLSFPGATVDDIFDEYKDVIIDLTRQDIEEYKTKCEFSQEMDGNEDQDDEI